MMTPIERLRWLGARHVELFKASKWTTWPKAAPPPEHLGYQPYSKRGGGTGWRKLTGGGRKGKAEAQEEAAEAETPSPAPSRASSTLGDEPLQDRRQTWAEFKGAVIRQEHRRVESTRRVLAETRAYLAFIEQHFDDPNKYVRVKAKVTKDGMEFSLTARGKGWVSFADGSINHNRRQVKHFEQQLAEFEARDLDALAEKEWKREDANGNVPAAYDPRTTGRAAVELAHALTDEQLNEALTSINRRRRIRPSDDRRRLHADAGGMPSGSYTLGYGRTVRGWQVPPGHPPFTLAEVAVLDALTLFTIGNVISCRDPSQFDPSASNEIIGIENWRVRPTAESYEAANVMLKRLSRKPNATEHDIYRGLRVPQSMHDALVPGAEFDLRDTSSWSLDAGVAENFAGVAPGSKKKTGKPVVFKMRTNRGVDVTDFSQYAHEQEVLVGGRVRVVKVEPTRQGGGKLVTVEVVEDDDLKKGRRARLLAAFQAWLDEALNKRVSGRKGSP